MKKTKRLGVYFLFSLLLTTSILLAKQGIAIASEIILPSEYYFVFNGQRKETGTEYELKSSEVLVNITAKGWAPETTVTWVTSEPGVVDLEASSHGSNFTKLVRKGPGYSTITAVVKHGSNTYSLSCVVKVDLSFDIVKTGLNVATTTNERILILNNIEDEKQIYLKYVDYIPDGGSTVPGEAISESALEWESSNEGVATVENGLVKAKGSGSTVITVTSKTMSSKDRPMSITLRVVVKPQFTITYDDGTGSKVANSFSNPSTATPAIGLPSNFVVDSKANKATDLTWVVKDVSNKGKVLPTSGPKLSYSVSNISGTVSFTGVKAGTYEIFAFANEKYNDETNAPYAYLKIVVPIRITDENIVMTVGDTYSIADNTNIPSISMFNFSYVKGNANIAQVDDKGVITAKRKGNVVLRLTYRTEHDLFDDSLLLDGTVPATIDINITVIDGIALDITTAKLYTSGTLVLTPIVTDGSVGVKWESNNTKIATVDQNGLVTGIKPGTATITVSQNIDGVVKKATCIITVQQSVTTVTVSPSKVEMPIGGYETLYATVTPKDLVGVKLTWRSSDEKVVKILKSDALTATIEGVSGGNAVISAINQDNVVVGFTHVTVQQPVTSIVLSETNVSLSLTAKRFQLRATVYPENATNKKVNWESSDPKIATVNASGLVTFIRAGKVSIIATSDDNGKVRAISNVIIEVPVATVSIDEKELIMYSGETRRLNYVVLPLNSSNNSLIWSSTNPSIASVDNTGRVTAKGVGTAVIMLKSVDGSHTAYTTIIVKKLATAIKFKETNLTLNTGDYYYLRPDLTPKDSTDTNILWESSDTKVAVVDTNGKVDAKSAGTAIIMARTETGAMAFVKLTVNQRVAGLILNFDEKTLYVGEDFKLKASVSPSTASQLEVTYTSSNTDVATVDEDGEVKALMGGTTVITVKTVEGGYVATCVVHVRELVTSIKMSHDVIRIGKDKTFKLEAIVSTQTASNKKVTWKSSNTKVATVNSNGKVTAVNYGFAEITATAEDGSEVEGTTEVEVVRPVTKVSLNKSYQSMLVGDVVTLKATVTPKNATYKELDWISSDTSIAIVDEDGSITALKAGSVTITAKAQDDSGKRAITHVTVSERIPSTTITVADKKITMVAGESKLVQPVMNPINSTDRLAWSTDNAGVAKVNKQGKITAIATGTAIVTVMTDSGKSAKIEVNVIGLNRTKLTLEQYTEYFLFVEGATGTVRWDVENSKIATVQNGRVVSRAVGTTTVYATVNGRRIGCKLTVTKIK